MGWTRTSRGLKVVADFARLLQVPIRITINHRGIHAVLMSTRIFFSQRNGQGLHNILKLNPVILYVHGEERKK
jgi:hypothetical protein